MSTPRTKHSPVFKAKVALAAIQEQETIAEIARRYKVHANLVYKWRQHLTQNLPLVFETPEPGRNPTGEREAELLQKIGELTVERDFLAKGSARSR
jgi:transposase